MSDPKVKLNLDELLPAVINIARDAGAAIMAIYQGDFDFETKGDGSPLTIADQRASDLIVKALLQLTPDIPTLSEENVGDVGDQRLAWERYWLVDPLDGTKEFIKRNGEFTVNIALIDKGASILGVVYMPDTDTLYYGSQSGAYKQIAAMSPLPIQARVLSSAKIEIVASRSHMSDEVKAFQAALETKFGVVETISMGSSLKLCLVAEGAADFYPRLGPTSEWDTAAAQAVVEAAGGRVTDCDGERLVYNKASLLNPWFLVTGDRTKKWSCEGTQLDK